MTSNYDQNPLRADVDGTGSLGLNDNFVKSADDTYSHPAAGAGGFGNSTFGDSSNTRATGLDSTAGYGHSSNTHSTGFNSTTGGAPDTRFGSGTEHRTALGQDGNYGSQGTAAGQGSNQYDAQAAQRGASEVGTAEVISSYGGRAAGGPGGAGSSSGTATSAGAAGREFGTDADPSSFGTRTGTGNEGSPFKSNTDAYTGSRHPVSSTDQYGGSHHHNTGERDSSAAGLGAGAGAGAAVGAGAYGASRLGGDSNDRSTGQFGSDESRRGDAPNVTGNNKVDNTIGQFSSNESRRGDAPNVTGNNKIDNTIGQKVNENTDKDGFANLTGDSQPGAGLTGRVKPNLDNNDSPVVETTKKRSERDSQGRELDSYGKPYEL